MVQSDASCHMTLRLDWEPGTLSVYSVHCCTHTSSARTLRASMDKDIKELIKEVASLLGYGNLRLNKKQLSVS